jgi:four helix bundle protein
MPVISYQLSAISYQVRRIGPGGEEKAVGDYRKLKCWHKAHELAKAVYQTTAHFPESERYGLVNQMRRAAVSVACNIAEGVGRNRSAETARFLRIALGSCTELEYQVLLSQHLSYLEPAPATQLLDRTTELRAMLASFHRRLQAQPKADS